MDHIEFVQWLKSKDLFHVVQANYKYFSNVLDNLLHVRKEQLLIIGDTGYQGARVAAIITGCYLLAAKRLNLNYRLIIQDPKASHTKADCATISSLSQLPARSVLVISISGKLGALSNLGKSFRKFIKEHNHRFASSTGMADLPTKKFHYLIKAMDIDYEKLNKKAQLLKEKLDRASSIRITTAAGTDLSIDISGQKAVANTGHYNSPRSGGNIPCGEVYIPPKKNLAKGRVVIDCSIKVDNATIIVKNPVELTFKEGVMVNISGGSEARLLEQTLLNAEKKAKYPYAVRRLGEIGIGINPNATIAGPTIINEKVLGTAHIALGSNAWFGGTIYAIVHLDQVFKNPTVYIDNEKVRI